MVRGSNEKNVVCYRRAGKEKEERALCHIDHPDTFHGSAYHSRTAARLAVAVGARWSFVSVVWGEGGGGVEGRWGKLLRGVASVSQCFVDC